MKTVVRIVVLFTLVATMVTAGMAQDSVSADVPFSFTVNHQLMPAGRYTVAPLQSPDYKTLVIRGEGKTAIVLGPFLNSVNSDPKLVFHRIGDQFFLSSVTGIDHEYDFPVSTPERKAMKTAQVSEITLMAGK